MLASAMPLLLMPTLQSVEGQFLGDDDSALSGFNNTTTTNNEGLQLDLSATSNNNNTLLREHENTIRFYAVPLLREAIEDRVGEGNADNVRIEIVGFGSNHTTVGTDDAVSLMKREFNSMPKASGDSTTAGFEITLDSSQCSSPSPDPANAGECQFTITAITTAEGMDNEGLQLDLSATSNNNTLLREHEKTIRFYAVPLLREAIEDRVGEGNADNVRIEIVGFGSNHTTVGTDDAVSLMRSEFNRLFRENQTSTTAGFEITLDSSQCSSPSPDPANAGECQFTIRLAQKANQTAEAAGGMTTIRPPEESGTIGLNDESEQNGTSNNNDDNNDDSSSSISSSSSSSSSSSNDDDNSDDNGGGDDNGDDCDNSYPDVCIPPPPPVLECSDIDEEDFEVRGSDPHGFDSNDDGVGCEEEESSSNDDISNDEIDGNRISNTFTNILDDIFGDDNDNNDDSSSSSSSSSNDNNDVEIDGNRISNTFTNKLDDIFGDRLVIAEDRVNSVLDRITEDKAQIRQTIEQIAEQIAGATDTD
jgi:hypothetical protein